MIIQRLTGDPHPQELVAPQWAVKKSETLAKINNTLEKRDSRQGMKLPSSKYQTSNGSTSRSTGSRT
jgi:radical SAM superfamily enzyme